LIEVLLLLGALALVVACGAFVAAEFAFVTVDRASAERAADAGDARARGVVAALRSLSTQLSAAQLGITVTNLLIGFMAEPAIARLIDGPLTSIGLSEDAAEGVALIVALVLATGATMVFGELVPKNLAIAKPLATAKAVQGFQRGFTRSTAILIRAFNGTANAILRRLGIEPQEELASARSPEELASLAGRSAQQGTLEPETATMLQRSITFGDRRATDVMTPQVRVHTLHEDAPVLEVLRRARATGRSRFPVLAEGNGRVVGVVHVKHAMAVPHERRGAVPVADVMVEPVLVPSTVELDPLLAMLRAGGLQMAIVIDEWGNVDGIVTLEDLIEEIVGDVRDEYDPGDDSIRPAGRDAWNVSALLRPDEIAGRIGVALPEDEEYETLGGLIGLQLERMPEQGDVVEHEDVRLTVLGMDGYRVDRVRIERLGGER
jgi:CBS domain containing-hemolysin-like protein